MSRHMKNFTDSSDSELSSDENCNCDSKADLMPAKSPKNKSATDEKSGSISKKVELQINAKGKNLLGNKNIEDSEGFVTSEE